LPRHRTRIAAGRGDVSGSGGIWAKQRWRGL